MLTRLTVGALLILSTASVCGPRLVAADKKGAAKKKAAQAVDGWGTVADPANDSTVGEKEGKVTIKVPGGNHNLNPTFRYGTNAPRIMQKVTGDFTVQVKVTFSDPPGTTSAVNGRPFNGAGILVWQDEQNFLRLERNCYWDGAGQLVCYPPLIEDWIGGKYTSATAPVPATFFTGPSTWFRISRQGGSLGLAMSQDGAEWSTLRTVTMDLPDEISVGVAAVNSSTKSFTAEFEGLELKSK
jgi:regulation of enolase protein 1 (concanavalin A-like superfamily)